ncbi:TetR family transcriptional regulator [Nocardia tenerifensis]|uniref:TetR family transcriptional regulator n=1 Tax=Nocardia tenerifensis TaxID=228006 RepID=A0A318K9L5_9NOCA|nr:TetR/AcrR family transcriptional regulator [Nocardia tenerifensis]PXX68432.1 TetR family transcriptional regulator [Nocardia tenerifensis]
MPRPRSLTKSDLGAAALAVIDRDGLSALTMRAVAKELRMATMALYRYVADREELENLVIDVMLADLDVSTPADSPWRDRVTTLLHRMRAAVSAHPATVPLMPRHRERSAATLRWMEAMLAVLTEGGFAGAERVIAQRTLVAFLLGFLQNEHYASINAPATAAIAQLSPDEYPTLTETAAQARKMSVTDEFHGGLAIVLRGLANDS